MDSPREHILQALKMIGQAQAEITQGDTLVAKGTLLLVTNELNYALAALFGETGVTKPTTDAQPVDPFRCDPRR